MNFHETPEYPQLKQVQVRITVDDVLIMDDDPYAYDDEGAVLQTVMMYAEDGMRRARAKLEARRAKEWAEQGELPLSNEGAPEDLGVAVVLLFPEELT